MGGVPKGLQTNSIVTARQSPSECRARRTMLPATASPCALGVGQGGGRHQQNAAPPTPSSILPLPAGGGGVLRS